MYSLPHVTNSVLKRAKDEGIVVTPMKLQKLLYFLYKDYLEKTGGPLFSERFQPWQYGPVLSDVYDTFKKHKGNPIHSYYPDADGVCRYIIENSDSVFQGSFDCVWGKYANYTGAQLSQFTHQIGSAWSKAVDKRAPLLSDADIKNEPDYLGGFC